MDKFTLGPWSVRIADEWSHSVVTDHGELPDGSRNLWTIASCNTRRDESEANARLIAAAPDLLEACRTLVQWHKAENNALPFVNDDGKAFYERVALCEHSHQQALAAIAKATGQTS